jgi:hypothetical protein
MKNSIIIYKDSIFIYKDNIIIYNIMNYIILIFCSIILPIISLQNTKPKLCINCKYFIPDNDDSRYSKCSFLQKEESKAIFLVDGKNYEDYYYCSTSRSNRDMCGIEGKYYKKNIVKNTNIK